MSKVEKIFALGPIDWQLPALMPFVSSQCYTMSSYLLQNPPEFFVNDSISRTRVSRLESLDPDRRRRATHHAARGF